MGTPRVVQSGEARAQSPRHRARAPDRPLAAVEIALRDSEASYRQLVHSLPVAFYSCDGEGRVTLFNDAAATVWGRKPVLGKDLWCGSLRVYQVDGTLIPRDRFPLAVAVRDGIEVSGAEAVVERPDGTRRSVLVYPQVFRDATGRVIRAVNALVDITERKAAEAELAATKDDLAQQVRSLTRLHARLSDADRRKDIFLATLAHELRNPLTPIRNAMHMIRLAGDNRAAVAQTRAMIERQLSQLVRLVDDLLDVSRISRGKIELRRERVELQAIVRQAIETSRALVDYYGHRLEVVMPPTPHQVVADPARLAQVFSNLINNAAKFTPAGGHIRVEVATTDGGATVSVRDNGIGIPAELAASVFEMFTQADTTLDKSRGGLGVGLAIVKRLIELHGGRVEAKSDGPNAGSELIVHLPSVEPEAMHSRPAPEFPALRRADAPSMGPSKAPSKRRILVVDDNVDLATSLAMMLQMLGHEVRTVHDGRAAIDATAQFAPDIVFLDIGMPRMNGFETCREIRNGPHGQEAVIVALSGWGQEQDKERSREAGMDLHLVKPFDPALLESMLAKITGRDTGSAPAPRVVPPVPEAPPEAHLEAANPAPTDADLSPASAEAAVEAARYALYRRILPVLRHGLVGELQNVQFAVDLAKRKSGRCGAAEDVVDAIERIADQADSAVGRGQVITDWMRPDPGATTTVGEAVHACLDLVGTEWSLRGIEVDASIPAAHETVKSAPFREIVVAMLVALGDAAPDAADITLIVRKRAGQVIVSMRARAAARDGAGARVSLYRDLRWSDVAALARTHGIAWARRGDHAIVRIPLAV